MPHTTSPTPLGIPFILQELMLHNVFFQFFAISHVRQPFVFLSLLQVFIVSLSHSCHSYYNIPQKTQNHFGATSNARKFNNHSFLLFFRLG